MRKRAGIAQRYSTGTDEVEYSNVTRIESGRERGLGRCGYRQGDVLTGNLRNNEDFYRDFSLSFFYYVQDRQWASLAKSFSDI